MSVAETEWLRMSTLVLIARGLIIGSRGRWQINRNRLATLDKNGVPTSPLSPMSKEMIKAIDDLVLFGFATPLTTVNYGPVVASLRGMQELEKFLHNDYLFAIVVAEGARP